MELATFAAGCFWGVEAEFKKLKGVKNTTVGYIGGHKENPTYQEVCNDRTGHAEAVQIEYDPEEISYEDLLDKFWEIHDPTQKNRQGPDIDLQYRSVIFYHNKKQKKLAETSKKNLEQSGNYQKNIETLIQPADNFWEAEEYHQDYFNKNLNSGCKIH